MEDLHKKCSLSPFVVRSLSSKLLDSEKIKELVDPFKDIPTKGFHLVGIAHLLKINDPFWPDVINGRNLIPYLPKALTDQPVVLEGFQFLGPLLNWPSAPV